MKNDIRKEHHAPVGIVPRTMLTPKTILRVTLLWGALASLLVHFAAADTPPKAASQTYGPYRVKLVRVVDGDTIRVRVALWPGLTQEIRVRLAGVDAPELHAKAECERKAAEDAREFTLKLVTDAKELIVQDVRRDKYNGRVLGRLLADGRDLSQALLDAHLARPYFGGKREHWC